MKQSAQKGDASEGGREGVASFGDGEPYVQGVYLARANMAIGQAQLALLELGRCLLVMKENEPHGKFTELVTGHLGLGMRSAQMTMQAAAKYLSPKLAPKAQALALLGRSKLLDLMAESDDDLADLVEGGKVAGKTFSEIQCMTTRELQAALEEAHKKLKTRDRQLADKSKKIDELDEALRLERDSDLPINRDEQAQLVLLRNSATTAVDALLRLLGDVDTVMQRPATEAAEKASRYTIDYLVQRIVDACLERGFTVDLADRVTPLWATSAGAAAGAEGRAHRG